MVLPTPCVTTPTGPSQLSSAATLIASPLGPFSCAFSRSQSANASVVLAAAITAALPTLKDLVAKVLAILGVGDIVKPTADALMAKVEALANPA